MKAIMKRFISVSLLLVIFIAAYTQDFRHYTTVDGLSGMDVTAICENNNYLWIATNDGLNRFDGKEFKVYRHNSLDENSLTENNIETLMFDSKGYLWIGFKSGGVDIFNPRKNEFIHISQIMKDYPKRVVSIYEDSQNNIWMGSWKEGLFLLEPTGDAELSYKVYKHYEDNIIASIIEKPTGKLWIGSYFGYFLFDIKERKEIKITPTDYAITHIIDAGEKNSLYFSAWYSGLHKLEWDETFTTKERLIIEGIGDIYRIFPTLDSQLYLGTWGNGLKIINTKHPSSLHSLPGNAPVILSFFRDRNNNLWVGTYGNGLYRLQDNAHGIQTLSPINSNGYSAAYALLDLGNDNILIGTQGDGLYTYDINKRTLYPKQIKSINTLFSKYILSMYKDDEVLIVGNDDLGIQYAPSGKGDGANFLLQPFYIDNNFGKVTSIFKSSANTYWIGTKQSGLASVKYDAKKKVFTDYTHYDSFGMDEITGFVETADKQIWISSHSGIYLFDPFTNKTKRYGNYTPEMIYSLIDDSKNGCLWLGTSNGLRKLDYAGNKDILINPFSSTMLPEEAIHNVALDQYNNLWFSVANRLFCYTESNKELREINTKATNKHIFLSSCLIKFNNKEHIAFGGTDNLLLIDPHLVLNQTDQIRIIWTELQIDHQKIGVGQKVYGKIVLKEDTEYTNTITLSHQCKWIGFSLVELGWNSYNNTYQYYVEGFSDNWQYLDISKPITFSQLPPGNYKLLIRLNHLSSDLENAPIWSLNINITPPWWRTNTAYFFFALSVLLFLFSIFLLIKNYYKKRQIQRMEYIERKNKEELIQEKEIFFAGLSHDLLTPLSLIIAPINDLMKDDKIDEDHLEKLEIVYRNAILLSEIFSGILDYKRVELTDVEVKEKQIELVSFVQIIVDAFDYMAKSNNIKLEYKTSINQLYVSIDTIKLERILYNLTSNSLKYTEESGSVSVSLSYDNVAETIRLDVKDTGIGIEMENQDKIFNKFYREGKKRSEKGLGLGLYTVRKFVDLMGGKIYIESKVKEGTIISITLPVKKVESAVLAEEEKASDNMGDLFSILIVEDNDELRNYLKKRLSEDFNIAVAANGIEALNFIQKNLPEIVISDVMMTEMDGLMLCSTIKQTPIYSDIFVILLSAKSSSEDEMRGYKAGADLYIKKPFIPDILISQILNVYTTREQRKKQIISNLLFTRQNNEKDTDKLSIESNFLNKAVKVIEDHLMDGSFNIEEFASKMNLSKTVLHRKFKLILGETPNVFIRNIRLRKAADMLEKTDLPISEIAYLTGFCQAHYFTKCFRDLYKVTPKNHRDNFQYSNSNTVNNLS
jgi:signal transduction histidine kinase/ligand-binding sensor domain-containing protein/DNA-binding response OmpR family regulator